MPVSKSQIKAKVSGRVLVYGEGKTPGVDEPDEIKEGKEQILQYEPSIDRWRNEETGRFAQLTGGKPNGFNKRGV
jgi:hypothetical protein